MPFENLKVLRLSRISLTNLTQFLSKSQGLKTFKVTNIGRRERPRWTDCRIMQVRTPDNFVQLLKKSKYYTIRYDISFVALDFAPGVSAKAGRVPCLVPAQRGSFYGGEPQVRI